MNLNEIDTWVNSADLPMKLASEMYELTKNLPKEELYGLKSRAMESSVSIPSSLSKGIKGK